MKVDLFSPFLSVILPTYNRKNCVTQMIDSILGQSFCNFECIVVDDGSVDATFEELQKRYSDERLRVLRKENGGVSSARNFGISHARGEYLTFVDSDDYILEGFFEDVYEMLQNSCADVLVYGGYARKKTSCKEVPLFWDPTNSFEHEITLHEGRDFVRKFCLLSGNSWGCAKVFKRSVLEHHGLCFNEAVNYGEDLLFSLEAYIASAFILTSPKKFYVYNVGNKSISRGGMRTKDKLKNLLLVYEKLKIYEQFRSLLAFNSINHMRPWIALSLFALDWKTKQKIKEIYFEAWKLHNHNRKLDEKIMSRSFVLFYFLNISRYVYSKFTFIHPLTSPIIRAVKRGWIR